MGPNKNKLISYLVQLALVAVFAVLVYNSLVTRLDVTTSAHRMYIELPQAWHVRCWSDALFIPAVLWMGMGGLLWIASTGFFDIFSYAFSSLLVLFTPFKNPKDHKHYYEYKSGRDEKRSGKPVTHTVLIVGVLLLVVSLALSFVHEGMVAPVQESLSTAQTETMQTDVNVNADDDTTGGNQDE